MVGAQPLYVNELDPKTMWIFITLPKVEKDLVSRRENIQVKALSDHYER